ncbi:MAG TPA: hypothetical protein PK358_04730 [Spirochaetota bacterium]|nr:hypothetical protein [Spirochaetota bacterium]
MGEEKVNKYIRYILWIAGLIFVLRIPTLYQHIVDIDETAFSEFARIIMNGGLPYVDAIDNKPPLTYYFFYLVYAFSGTGSLYVIHWVTTFWVTATGVGLFFFSSRGERYKNGFVAALVFAFAMHTYEPKYISTNGETLINLFLVFSAFIFISVKTYGLKNILLHILSGILLGLAVMTNYKAGILAVVFIIHSLFIEPMLCRERVIKFREGFIKLCITGFSSLLPVAAFALLFHCKGNFDEALFWGFLYNFGYIESGKGAFSSFKIIGRTGYFIILTLPAWILSVKYFIDRFSGLKSAVKSGGSKIDYSRPLFIFIWLGFSVYAATIGGRGYGHYFIQIVPPLSLAAAEGYSFISKNYRLFWVWLALPAIIFTASRIDILKSYELVNYPNYRSEISFRKTGEYIKSVSAPEDKIYTWGWGTPVYYFADRRSASRFLISDFISGRIFGTSNSSTAMRSEMQEKFMPLFMDDLKRNRPLFFVDTSPSGYFGYDRFPINLYPELDSFIRDSYQKDSVIDGIVIYKRKPD